MGLIYPHIPSKLSNGTICCQKVGTGTKCRPWRTPPGQNVAPMNTHDHLQNVFKGDILSRDNICPGTKCRGTNCLLTFVVMIQKSGIQISQQGCINWRHLICEGLILIDLKNVLENPLFYLFIHLLIIQMLWFIYFNYQSWIWSCWWSPGIIIIFGSVVAPLGEKARPLEKDKAPGASKDWSLCQLFRPFFFKKY